MLYIPNRICSLFAKQTASYITPTLKQGKKIVWNDQRLQTFCPSDFGVQVKEAETTITFPNGSFIELDGSENYEAHRGTGKDILMLDEFKDIDPRFYEATYPSLASNNGLLVIIGTPPKTKDSFYWELEQEVLRDKDWAFFKWSTWDNPYIPREWLEKEKEKYYRRGDGDIWQREYEAEYAFGGKDCIFPTWDRDKHTRDFHFLRGEMQERPNDWKLCVMCDPGTTSTFAVLFCGFNKRTGQYYIFDEIYEKDRSKMTSHAIWYRVMEKKQLIAPNKVWTHGYDEAAAWFANEVMSHFKQGLIPTKKAKIDQEKGISLIRELMARDKAFQVGKNCINVISEIENYFTDENGNFPKKNDHQIDNIRYSHPMLGVRFDYEYDPIEQKKRAYTMEDDMLKSDKGKDFYSFLDDDLTYLC